MSLTSSREMPQALLETGNPSSREGRATSAMHVERLLPQDCQFLDRERARDSLMQRADPGDVQRPEVHPEVPDEPSTSVPPSRLR